MSTSALSRDGLLDETTASAVGDQLTAYWRILLKHKWSILGLTIAFALLGSLMAGSMEPVYQAKVSVLIDSKRQGFSPVDSANSGGYGSYYETQSYLQTQLLLIRSRALAEDVVDRLGLTRHAQYDPRQRTPRRASYQFDWGAWFNEQLGLPPAQPESAPARTPSEESIRASVVSQVAGSVSAEVVSDSDILSIRFRCSDPDLAALIANTYAEAYIELGLETRLATVQKAASWLTERLDGLREKVEASEKRLQAYRETNGLLKLAEGSVDMSERELSDATDRMVSARARRDELQSLYQKLRQVRGLGGAELAAHPEIATNPIIQTLKSEEVAAERVVAELAKRYGERHPKMIAAREDLVTVRKSLNSELTNVVDGIRNQLEVARGQVATLERDLRGLKSNVQEVDRKEFTLRTLERDLETDRQLYELFLTRFKETDLGVDLESTNARVLDPARVPSVPVEPRTRRIITLYAVFAMVLGTVLALLSEMLDNTLKTGEDVEETLSLPVLGSLPLVRLRHRRGSTPERLLFERPKSEFAEAVRTLRTGVVLSGLDDPPHLILLTSAVPGEGKTTLSINLAASLGQLESVLLIGADMRRATLGKRLDLPEDALGLSNLMAGTADLDACIHRHEGAGIDVLPAGLIPPNPLELLSSKRFASTLEDLSQRYDRIIIDSAPAQAVSDALVLSKLVDAVIFVIKSDATPIPVVQIAVKRLRQVSAPLIGAVVNQFDNVKSAKYGYYRQGKYRRYSYAYGGYSSYDGHSGKPGS